MNNNVFSYTPLHMRSYFSLLRGCLSPEEICDYGCKEQYPAIGMVDINNLYGLIRFLKAAKHRGIKPVAGAAICLNGQELFTAYIMNRRGFSRLAAIITNVLLYENPYIKPVDRIAYDPVADLLSNGWKGLSLVSDNLALVRRLAMRGKKGLYVKLSWGKSFIQEVRWARQQGIPVIALNTAVVRAHPLDNKRDTFLYHLLRAIDTNTTIGNLREKEKLYPYQRIAAKEEMMNFFSAVPEALEEAHLLVRESRAEEILSNDYIFPDFNGMSEEGSFSHLVYLCKKGVTNRYGNMRTDISKRLYYELSIIKAKHFSSYFLVVRDIVLRCPRTCGRGSSASSIVSYLLGITHIDPLKYNLFFERFLNPGRKDPPDIDVDFPWDERDKVLDYVFKKYKGCSGMVANHVTFGTRSSIREPAKALGIPEEEIKRIIKLWRLEETNSIPGYLKELSHRIRGFPHYIGLHCGGVVITPGPITHYTHVQVSLTGYPVIAWEKDGTEDAGLVKIDLLGNRSLSVLRDTIALVRERHNRTIPWDSFNPLEDKKTRELICRGQTLGIFYVESPATRQLLQKMKSGSFEHLVIASSIIRPAANKYIREFVKRLHSGRYTPLHPLIAETLGETYGIMVYQEDVSRVAIDLAGFSVEEADFFRKIISKKDREYHIADFKDRFFSGGRSRGVSDRALKEAWDMILSFKGYSFCKAHSASYALVSYKLAYMKAYYPLEFMTAVINNEGGFYNRQTYLNELKRMGFPILGPDVTKSTFYYSIEDPVLLPKRTAGTPGENSDHPSKEILYTRTGKLAGGRFPAGKSKELSTGHFPYTHISSCIRGNCPCKDPGHRDDTRKNFPGDCTPDDRTGVEYTCEDDTPLYCVQEHSPHYNMTHTNKQAPPALRAGLGQLNELSRDFIKKIIRKRKEKPYCNFRDFIQRVTPGLPEIRILIRSGALDTLCPGIPRPALFWLYFHINADDELFLLPPVPEFITDYPPEVKIRDEGETLGVLISRHPLTLFTREIVKKIPRESIHGRGKLSPYPLITSREIPLYVNKKVSIAGLVVTGKEVITKDNEMMIFVSFEDPYSIYETVFFPSAFRTHHYILEGSMVYLIRGKVEEDQGALCINVEGIEKMTRGDEEE